MEDAMRTSNYGLFIRTRRPFSEALEAMKDALKAEGFGVLTDIDVKAAMQQKLSVDFRRYEILGACNPPLAHAALQAEMAVGLLLPCNVIVYEDDDGTCTIGALDPMSMMSFTGNEALSQVANEARTRLERVLASLEEAVVA
jgi:uncharacterized protein (DUF302 family)